MIPFHRLGDRGRDERAGEVRGGGDQHGQPRREGARRDRGRDGVRGVVEAVREVEAERDQDDHDEQDVVHG
jgi:hypothetical protein